MHIGTGSLIKMKHRSGRDTTRLTCLPYRQPGPLIDQQLEDIRAGIVAHHIEIEFGPDDLAEVQFSEQDGGSARTKIETYLAGALKSDRQTHTM